MNIYKIRHILSGGELSADQVNPIINTLQSDDLDKLSKTEKDNLREIVSKALVLAKDPSSGVYINDISKAEALLSAIG